ncbi:arginine--tRNA ligase [Psychrobium sp. 1_MG-2023]|uniref:arginine--tRNA ligase n=1 Tax=Psychrobium sp. 1_MG-2023 TaxID=3062624 RepID=UPI000C326C54|nr:arginine--tRNA ligase [Psychrobium sp. 1_MG-2023]MDP2562515.1 arginine--tRNA ligase [Psychrobium sp. 1_MG-2023]PKF57993.1 arginine--tRNA ligase [Alteromonadales bacterium alter-6D02]
MKENIQQLLEQTVAILKQENILPAEAAPRIQVDRTKDKSHGDFATNLALMTAKPAGKNPRELAQLICQHLPQSAVIAKTEIAGPGFINFFVADNALTDQLEAAYQDANLNVSQVETPQTIVVDYSAPNLAKEMHVGHLRSAIIGDSVVRTLEFLGHKVIRQNHVGDWGTQFGMLLTYMERLQQQGGEISMELHNLEQFYRAAKQCFDEDESFSTRAREMVVKLQSGDEQCKALWQQFIDISLSHCQETYDRLGVSLTRKDVMAESAYNDDLVGVVESLKEQGLLVENDGAQCVFLEQFKGKNDEPLPIIIQKTGGGFLYATTDMAATRYRNDVLNADRVLYFVDARQSLHFQQIFALAKKAKFAREEMSLEHMAFGTVMGEDGKPFKTRSGEVAKLADLLSEAQQRAFDLVKSKNPDMDEAELKAIADVVGISAVKYADLSKARTSDYTFSFDSMLSFEGNTAPYILYAYTRVASIFAKAGVDADNLSGEISLDTEQEKALGTKLMQFNDALGNVAAKGLPHVMCTYLYELAGSFSSFYEACPILVGDDEAVKQSRLKLAALTAKTLQQGLSLLGIKTLERM